MLVSGLDPSLTTVLVGGASGLLTLVVSKWLDNSHGDRREAALDRRQQDQERRRELERCQDARELQRDVNAALQAYVAALSATLIANEIPLPPPPTLLHTPD